VTPEEAVPILARWIAELEQNVAELRIENAFLQHRARVAADIRWWMENHTPEQVLELAEAIA
jgi:hypothetical protein